jgi:transcriptional antiterminator Rof (Rho-off)
LEAKLACSDTAVIDNKILNNAIDKLEKELGQLYEQKAKGAQIRFREKWVEFGENNNAYFLGLEKKRQIKSLSHTILPLIRLCREIYLISC